MQQIEKIAEEVVSRLFANGKTPMEHFGINWEQAERLERDIPQIVMGYDPNEDCLHRNHSQNLSISYCGWHPLLHNE
ncbi:hypothetical protein [Xenorhabdus sp. BG5]|uniref:hypothetical protein n=1 Tax=Xenorhabdus sp. BG5 TaxID=2782014 RepID=UPI001882EB39|nr:hypothetical protein [Xenorhabdus sp. BG5]MBE8597889.1 hypothetical protein [Xenorhabdus sp. BG5]